MFDIKALEKLRKENHEIGLRIEHTDDTLIKQKLIQDRKAIELIVIALVLHSDQMELLS